MLAVSYSPSLAAVDDSKQRWMPLWGDDLLIALKAVLNAMVYEVVLLRFLCDRVLFGSKENPQLRWPPALP